MPTVKLVTVTRGAAIIEVDGEIYHIGGEGFGDGTWEIYCRSVYKEDPSGELHWIDDDQISRTIIEHLPGVWPDYPHFWKLRPVKYLDE